MLAVGADLGYGYSKVASSLGEFKWASAVGTPDISRFGLEVNGTRQLVVDGNTWLVGEEAVEQSRFIQRREDRRWFESAEYHTLFLAALDAAINGNGGEHQVQLVTGLPLAYYDDKDALETRLLGRFTIQRKGQSPRYVRVRECRIVPQPFGSLFSLAFDAEGQVTDGRLLEGVVGIIDIGSKTTNILAATKARELLKSSTSVNSGGWDIVRAVQQHLRDTFQDADPRDHEVAQAIVQRSYNYYGRKVDLSAVVDDVVQPFAEQVAATASQLWNRGATMDTILIAGGGAHLVGQALKVHFSRHADVRVVADPQMSNVRGYYRYARFLCQ